MALFKYMHPDRIDVLRTRSIRFTSPAALNDPFELKPHLHALASPEYIAAEYDRLLPGLLQEEIEKLPPELRARIPGGFLTELLRNNRTAAIRDLRSMSTSLMPKLQQTMARKLEELVGILCLSESPSSLLMWAHYADCHRGFCIEFDEQSSFFDRRLHSGDELRHLRRVTYSASRPSLTLADVEDFSAFLTKGLEWAYEAEWRMIVRLDTASQTIGEGPKAIHLFEFPGAAISSVIFGCRMDESRKSEIRELLADSPHYRHVRCAQADIDSQHYSLRVRYEG